MLVGFGQDNIQRSFRHRGISCLFMPHAGLQSSVSSEGLVSQSSTLRLNEGWRGEEKVTARREIRTCIDPRSSVV